MNNNLGYTHSLLHTFLWAAYLIVMHSCANPVSPTGGPKDETPPEVIESNPDNNSTLFSAKKVEIKFNEYIQIKNLHTELLTAPFMKEIPTVKINGKSLAIYFEDSLLQNTTYILNFGKAIQDLNEGNALENYTYAFSTGTYIDSLQLSGFLFDAQTHKPVKDIKVYLYDSTQFKVSNFCLLESADTNVSELLPDYIAKTDDKGKFSFTHLKNKKYYIFSLVDANSNYIYDLPTEAIAFLGRMVTPNKDSLDINLFQFTKENNKFFIETSQALHYGKVNIVFNRPPDSLTLKTNIADSLIIFEYSEKRDSLNLWISDTIKDTLEVIIKNDTSFSDTIHVLLIKEKVVSNPKTKKGKNIIQPTFKPTIETNIKGGFIKPFLPLTLKINHPLKAIDTNKIYLTEDSVKINPKIMFKDSLIRNILLFKYQWKTGAKYMLTVNDSVLCDMFNEYNDSVSYSFKPQTESNYGTLIVSLLMPQDSLDSLSNNIGYIFQLLDDKMKVISERIIKNNEEIITLNHLDVKSYSLKLIRDFNLDNKWSSGDLMRNIQPEPVYFYDEPVFIKGNWEMEIEWMVEK